MQIVCVYEISKRFFFYKTKRKKKCMYFFRKSMRSGTACAVIISGAHIIPNIQREIWICDITKSIQWYHKFTPI